MKYVHQGQIQEFWCKHFLRRKAAVPGTLTQSDALSLQKPTKSAPGYII